jgi:hypothetical protein
LLKADVAGLKDAEVARLKKAVSALSVDWLFAALDGVPCISCHCIG